MSDNGFTIEQARALLNMEEQKRMQACMAEINAVLERYGCDLGAQVIIDVNGKINKQIVLISRNDGLNKPTHEAIPQGIVKVEE